jgi:hypothetical protein
MVHVLAKTGVCLLEGGCAALAVLAFCQGHNTALMTSLLAFFAFRTARLVMT